MYATPAPPLIGHKTPHNTDTHELTVIQAAAMSSQFIERPMTLPEMARDAGVPVAWLRAEAERGALTHIKAGRGMLFHPKVIHRILLQRARKEGLRAVDE